MTKIFLCALCQQEFDSLQKLVKHVKTIHKTAFTVIGEKEVIKKKEGD